MIPEAVCEDPFPRLVVEIQKRDEGLHKGETSVPHTKAWTPVTKQICHLWGCTFTPPPI